MKINHCDTISESTANSIHATTAQVGGPLEWIPSAESTYLTSNWGPKIVLEWDTKLQNYGSILKCCFLKYYNKYVLSYINDLRIYPYR
jgi:hypothetical protein